MNYAENWGRGGGGEGGSRVRCKPKVDLLQWMTAWLKKIPAK